MPDDFDSALDAAVTDVKAAHAAIAATTAALDTAKTTLADAEAANQAATDKRNAAVAAVQAALANA